MVLVAGMVVVLMADQSGMLHRGGGLELLELHHKKRNEGHNDGLCLQVRSCYLWKGAIHAHRRLPHHPCHCRGRLQPEQGGRRLRQHFRHSRSH